MIYVQLPAGAFIGRKAAKFNFEACMMVLLKSKNENCLNYFQGAVINHL